MSFSFVVRPLCFNIMGCVCIPKCFSLILNVWFYNTAASANTMQRWAYTGFMTTFAAVLVSIVTRTFHWDEQHFLGKLLFINLFILFVRTIYSWCNKALKSARFVFRKVLAFLFETNWFIENLTANPPLLVSFGCPSSIFRDTRSLPIRITWPWPTDLNDWFWITLQYSVLCIARMVSADCYRFSRRQILFEAISFRTQKMIVHLFGLCATLPIHIQQLALRLRWSVLDRTSFCRM